MPLDNSNNTSSVVLSIVAYSLCSGTLVLINKLILHELPFPSLVMTIQLWATLVFIYAGHTVGLISEIDSVCRWECIKPYLAYTFAFSLGIYCNMRSLNMANVETVIVFRAMCPLLVSVADALFLGREWPSQRSWGALLLIAAGAYQYARTDEAFLAQGLQAYMWPFCYLLVISFEMAYGKKIVKSVPLKTLSGPVQYANLLGWPPMLFFAYWGGEFASLQKIFEEHQQQQSDAEASGVDNPMFAPKGWILLFVGCVVGTGIGYSGWWCRSKVSAASYTVIGVMNKCLTVLLNCLVWDQHARPMGIAALLVCLLGGAVYKQAPMAQDKHAKEEGAETQHDDEEATADEGGKMEMEPADADNVGDEEDGGGTGDSEEDALLQSSNHGEDSHRKARDEGTGNSVKKRSSSREPHFRGAAPRSGNSVASSN